MYSTSFKTPENLAVFDEWLLTECTWMGGGYLREVVVHGVLSVLILHESLTFESFRSMGQSK